MRVTGAETGAGMGAGMGAGVGASVVLPVPRAVPARTNVAFPFQVDSRGRTTDTGHDDHVRDMIEMLLFTSPGDRVMRPDFGCGLLDLVFEPGSPELAAALQLSVQASLQRWLGDIIDVRALEVESTDSALRIFVAYQVRVSGDERTDVFEVAAP